MDTGVDMGADTGAGADGGANTGAGISAATGGPANTKAVISVLGRDHKGIVARIATTLTECEANIDDISQTILGKMFSMTMLVTLSEALVPFDTVQERLARDAEALELQITLQRQDVFDFMYKI
jgi:ACT domain-containing protein